MDVSTDVLQRAIRTMPDEELLDRFTIYRKEMEPRALEMMECELAHRGISRNEIVEHEHARQEWIMLNGKGFVVRCRCCNRPAIKKARTWFRLVGWIPVYPILLPYCSVHAPGPTDPSQDSDA